MTDPLITVRGLTARCGHAMLLDGVELSVPEAQVTALVGPSGSGKTTTALALLGEAEPGIRLSGDVRVDGVRVVDETGATAEAARVRGGTVAYMPQHPASTLNPPRRIGSVLTELARLHGADARMRAARAARAAARRHAADALRQAQLPCDRGVMRRFPHQFSGGQRQRVALARTLVCGPRALVLDEPGTGLDAVTRRDMARELALLVDEGLTVLLLTHDHDLVRALATRAVRLEDGRTVDEGPAARVLDAARGAGTGRTRRSTARAAPEHGSAETVPTPAPRGRVPQSSPVLQVAGLTAWLGTGRRDPVLHDVRLDLRPGECLGVTGRSGSGKTTLARCVAGLHERHDGGLLLDGEPLPVLRRRTAEDKRRVQYVWQETRGSFDDRRTVLRQVARTAVRLRGLPPERAAEEAAELLERLGVGLRTADRPPSALSGGELQRAALARAALAGPSVLLCDEITSALDEDAAARVTAEVARLRREQGTAVLWIGHDLRTLSAVADRVLVLDGGRVAEQGGVREVLGAPRARATRRLTEAEPVP
ncbi:peptide/nickel transport system ATP-binding protein [Streptomyces sp. Amel2xB2]|uniref:ABC transporter ATP-binding protein n=1 Tax=Streptomyces sp. Amel2xB2 TaxID=1305829 RepID=UPI000DBAC4C4|nr:ATP-binding cassette domain-containing protein [Streptomyces sp. Amel2xB2]RAJ56590.1 peptide/nickel transport system ATP-binding protein [Streptomyces sp. Amel2xB2]